MYDTLIKLYKNISYNEKIKLIFVVFLYIFGSLLEVFSISLVFPLITILFDESVLLEIKYIKAILEFFSITNSDDTILFLMYSFISVTVLSVIFRIVIIRYSANFAFNLGHSISIRAYSNLIHKPYQDFSIDNSSGAISNIATKLNNVIQNLIYPVVAIIGSIIMLLIIIGVLIWVSVASKFVFIMLSSILSMYLIIIYLFKSTLQKNSIVVSKNQTLQVKSLQESLGTIKDIILTNSFNFFEQQYNSLDKRLRNKQALNILLGQFPRYLVETLSVVLILWLAVYYIHFSPEYDKNALIPVFATLAIAFQRILPYINQTYRSWANITSNQKALDDVLNMLKVQSKNVNTNVLNTNLSFDNSIELKNIDFCYQGTDLILKDISLIIGKGEKIGFVGDTGSGKSTILDIIMGLISPTSGQVLVDGIDIKTNIQNWHEKISHLSQFPYITDSDFSQNVAFGSGIINSNSNSISKSLKIACLDAFVDDRGGMHSKVGENGSLLSGGQRQRLGIARCIYKDSMLIVLDEATSALDSKTEGKIMENIYSLNGNYTILIIAHRISTLKNCDRIVELENGKIKRIGTFEDVESWSIK
jgi:ATP-binding cassette, subfamily B, bacterial PglK